MTCAFYASMVAGSSVRVSTTHCRLVQRLPRFDMTAVLSKADLSRHVGVASPKAGRSPRSMARAHRGKGGRLRGIHRHDGAEPLEAIQKRLEQLAHGLK